MIEINNVTKSYTMGEEKISALNEVSLTVEEGDFMAVTGPSGSGKSTLLYTIGGLLTPTHGNVQVNGSMIYSLTSKERARFRRENVGFIFQTFELLPYLTALENVMIPLSLAGEDSRDQEKWALEALEKVGLGKRATHKPNELSGGEQQRVAVARGLVNEANILLADEPTGNLDQKTGDEIMSLLRELNDEDGQTIIYVTHDQSNAKLADKVVGMIDGRIVTRINQRN
ncbi:MAG: ABC transporter ATP-binding protein [Candidatus Bathyarchaeota archaeon]|nr:ABC transporter ATP-binding protein [Candidatus Bathyarchaeota archaeon]